MHKMMMICSFFFLFFSFWKDHQWVSIKNLKLGLSTGKYIERLSVFGPNLINIHEKPITKLLTEEVNKTKIDTIYIYM